MRLLLALQAIALTGLAARSLRADQPASRTQRPPAEIILVGQEADCARVRDVVTELLSRDGTAVTWARQSYFHPRDIFDRPNEGVAAWIDLSTPAETRLYFRDAGADRFFIRRLPLARGIDEIAKEEIAHIVSSAVLALSQGGGETLTRSEARLALHMEPTSETEPEVSRKSPSPLRFAVAALAGAQLFASDLPVVARGTLSLAVSRGPRWSRAGGWFGGWLDLAYQVRGHYQGSAVGADVQAASLRAGVLWEIERSVLLRFGLGAGLDRFHYEPRGDTARVELASASSFYVPALSLWVGMELRLLDWLALTSRISLDATLARVHFDLHGSNGQTTRILVPYPVLPAASLGLAVIF